MPPPDQGPSPFRPHESIAAVASSGSELATPRSRSQGDLAEGRGPGDADDVHLHAKVWEPFKLSNGLALFKEEEDELGMGGAYMVSVAVRSSPKVCYDALMEVRGNRTSVWGFAAVEEIQDPGPEGNSGDGQEVMRVVMKPPGSLARFFSPRELLLRRNSRRCEDGSYLILLQSEPTEDAPSAGHVRANLTYAGFTFAPLKAQRAGHEGGECLVTMVVKMELGGWLDAGTWGGYFLESSRQQWTEHVLMTVVALRDKVEMDRFQMSPFTLFAQLARDEDHSDIQQLAPPSHRGLLNLPLSHPPQPATVAPRLNGTIKARSAGIPSSPKRISSATHPAPTNGHASGSKSETGTPMHMSIGASYPLRGRTMSDVANSALPRDLLLKAASEQLPVVFLPPRYWKSPGAANFRVRGPDYLASRKKIPAVEPIMRLAAVELVRLAKNTPHVSRYLPCVRRSRAPFNFVMALTIPWGQATLMLVIVWESTYDPRQNPHVTAMNNSPTGGSSHTHLAAHANGPTNITPRVSSGLKCEFDSESDLSGPFPWELLLHHFVSGFGPEADRARDNKIKLIPSIVEGSWIVRQSVGQTPVMLGRKLKTSYYHGPNYLEIDIDISANATAATVTSMVAGWSKSIVLDIAVLLEGQSPEELPERLLGTIRLQNLDLKAAIDLECDVEVPSAVQGSPHGLPSSDRGSGKSL